VNLAYFDIDPRREDYVEFMGINVITHKAVNDALLATGVVVPQYALSYPEITPDFVRLNKVELDAWSAATGLDLPGGLDTADPQDYTGMNYWLSQQKLFVQNVSAVLNL
jgi:hypothetical protein